LDGSLGEGTNLCKPMYGTIQRIRIFIVQEDEMFLGGEHIEELVLLETVGASLKVIFVG
jgi:hypothetical protein